LFPVRSTYKLAVEPEQKEVSQGACSGRPDGSRSLYKGIWKAKVSPKVRVFTWRLAQEGLATQSNRKKRTLVKEATCQVCGAEDETAYHTVILSVP
jgi:hypothetical protein